MRAGCGAVAAAISPFRLTLHKCHPASLGNVKARKLSEHFSRAEPVQKLREQSLLHAVLLPVSP
ncbi:hypothetical protein ASF15_03920 [Pseudomonas sp. Leaf83]|nr:hypothetical protein ASF15_03920 [Pseudomonas sp. Leaf83]